MPLMFMLSLGADTMLSLLFLHSNSTIDFSPPYTVNVVTFIYILNLYVWIHTELSLKNQVFQSLIQEIKKKIITIYEFNAKQFFKLLFIFLIMNLYLLLF
jgi:hypothetical protein